MSLMIMYVIFPDNIDTVNAKFLVVCPRFTEIVPDYTIIPVYCLMDYTCYKIACGLYT
jgi:hypothetical protein